MDVTVTGDETTAVYEVVASSGQVITNLDFGNYQPGSVHGRKWHDINGDGARDPDEPYLNDWTFELIDADGNVVATAVSHDLDVDGSGDIDPETERGWYWFEDVAPGGYSVHEVPQPGWVQSEPAPPSDHQVIVVSQSLKEDVDFGNEMLSVEIVSVTPNPRAGLVDSITIVFSHAMDGLDVGDLTLVHADDAATEISLETATLTTSDMITWELGNLGGLTSESGHLQSHIDCRRIGNRRLVW